MTAETTGALSIGDPVEVIAGEHKGLCGFVWDMTLDHSGPRTAYVVVIRLQDGSFIGPRRSYVRRAEHRTGD